jgi:hypothetical protein
MPLRTADIDLLSASKLESFSNACARLRATKMFA